MSEYSERQIEPPFRRPALSYRLSAAVGRLRWPLLGAWLILIVLAAAVAGSLPDRLTGGGWVVPGSDPARVEAALHSGFVGRGPSTVMLVVRDGRFSTESPEFADRSAAVYEWVRNDPALAVRSAYGWSTLDPSNRAGFVGRDQRTVITSLGLALDEDAAEKVLPDVQGRLGRAFADQGIAGSLLSGAAFRGETGLVSQQLLTRAELFTLPVLVVMLLLLYRSVTAAALSLAVGGSAVLATLAVLTPIASTTQLSVFVLNVVTMLGLGVGIDYSLLTIRRFTEQLKCGEPLTTAVAVTLQTAGRAVIVSGVTVILATATLFVVHMDAIRSMAIGAVLVVGTAVCATVVVLPVLFHVLGGRMDGGRMRLPSRRGTTDDPWYRHAQRVMRRPVLYLAITATAMGVLAVPGAHTEISAPDAQILPTSNALRQSYDAVTDQFGPGMAAPITIVISSVDPLAEHVETIDHLIEQLHTLPGVGVVRSGLDAVTQVSPQAPFQALSPTVRAALPADAQAAIGHYFSADGRSAVVEVIPTGLASDPATFTLLDRVRTLAHALTDGLHAAVGGDTATSAEASGAVGRNLPALISLMLLAVFVSLVVTFRSLLLPLKAITMNLLTVGAAYGVLVVVFQWGHGRTAGFDTAGYLVFFVPVLMLALLFGVNTDYEVFLLSRVREEYLRSGDNDRAVAVGLSRTAPVISWAAALMVVVFLAFGLTGLLPMQQLGLGLAVGVAADATIVRLMLVPAAMRLLGRWNWWFPFSRGGHGPEEGAPSGTTDRTAPAHRRGTGCAQTGPAADTTGAAH